MPENKRGKFGRIFTFISSDFLTRLNNKQIRLGRRSYKIKL